MYWTATKDKSQAKSILKHGEAGIFFGGKDACLVLVKVHLHTQMSDSQWVIFMVKA